MAQAWRAWLTGRFGPPGDVRIAIDAGVENTGSGAARGGWVDRAYLSADDTLDPNKDSVALSDINPFTGTTSNLSVLALNAGDAGQLT
ncbi:MAG: hypothetical protein AAGA57_04385, partial [Planctomycetota bacterium]